jgi:hypothetical protein
MKPLELMKNMNLNKFLAAGLALAGFSLASSARAQTEVLFSGGNASQTILYDRVTNIFGGGSITATIAASNSVVRSYVGSISGAPAGVNPVTIDFSLLGAGQGLTDTGSQNTETTALGSNTIPAVAVSSGDPDVFAVDPSTLTSVNPSVSPTTYTLVIPYAYVKNASKSPNLANATNLTQFQANYLEGAAGYFPSIVLGGSSTSDTVYFVARNTQSAVRREIDANIYFTGTISTWTTNGSGNPIVDPNGGQSSGANVRANLAALPESIGTVASSDISTETPLAFEGVPYSIANVENGSYALWYYEQWFIAANPQTALTANQLTVINDLLGAVTNVTYQTTASIFTNYFVPLDTGSLKFSRTTDGGPITPINY